MKKNRHTYRKARVRQTVHTLMEWHQLCSNLALQQVYYGQHRRRS